MKDEIKKLAGSNPLIIMITYIMENIVAIFLMIIVIIAAIFLFAELPEIVGKNFLTSGVHEILATTFNLIIVIEFVRMLIKHSMENVIEVLIFAIARGLIVDHKDALAMVCSIGCLAILFAIRKYLLLPEDHIDPVSAKVQEIREEKSHSRRGA
jgi:uncharacterized membrane protein (DUF373 family)